MSKRKKNSTGPPQPRAPVAWCELHQNYINVTYMRRKHCMGQRGKPFCKHFRWLKADEEPHYEQP